MEERIRAMFHNLRFAASGDRCLKEEKNKITRNKKNEKKLITTKVSEQTDFLNQLVFGKRR